jgi:O-antigen/teichoic acid export membrane protein
LARSAADLVRGRDLDPATARGRSRERYRRALLGSGAAVAARGVGVAVSLLTVPLTLGYLGVERYGMWMTISSLIAFLTFTDLGIGNGLLTAIANATGRDDRGDAARYTASAVWMLLFVAVVVAAAVVGITQVVSWADLFNVADPLARAEAAPAMLAFGACFAVSLPLSTVTQVRYGYQEGYLNSAYVAAGSILGLVLVLVVINLQLGLPYLVVALMGAPILTSGANAAMLFGRERRWLAPRPGRVDPDTAWTLLRSGGQFLVLQLAVAAAFYSDSLIAARVIGPEAVAQYSIATKLFLVPTILVTAAVGPLWPAYGEAFARGDVPWLRRTLRRSLLLVLAVTLPLSAFLAILADPILQVWIGGAVSPPQLLVVGVAVWTVLSGIGTSLAMLLNGLHVLRFQIGTAVVMAVLNVALSVFLASRIGVAGVILGPVIASPASTLVPLGLYVPRLLQRLEGTHPRPPEAPAASR